MSCGKRRRPVSQTWPREVLAIADLGRRVDLALAGHPCAEDADEDEDKDEDEGFDPQLRKLRELLSLRADTSVEDVVQVAMREVDSLMTTCSSSTLGPDLRVEPAEPEKPSQSSYLTMSMDIVMNGEDQSLCMLYRPLRPIRDTSRGHPEYAEGH